MKSGTVIVLSVEEAKTALIEYYADFVVANKKYVMECLRNGEDLVPKISKLASIQIALIYLQLHLANTLVKKLRDECIHPWQVVIEVDKNSYYVVWAYSHE